MMSEPLLRTISFIVLLVVLGVICTVLFIYVGSLMTALNVLVETFIQEAASA